MALLCIWVYIAIHIHMCTHMQSHNLSQFSSFSVVSDIQFFDMDIEDMSVCLLVSWVFYWQWVNTGFGCCSVCVCFLFFLIVLNSQHYCHWGMFLPTCSKEASKSHKSKRKASQTSQHPWPFPHICSSLPTHAHTGVKRFTKLENKWSHTSRSYWVTALLWQGTV